MTNDHKKSAAPPSKRSSGSTSFFLSGVPGVPGWHIKRHILRWWLFFSPHSSILKCFSFLQMRLLGIIALIWLPKPIIIVRSDETLQAVEIYRTSSKYPLSNTPHRYDGQEDSDRG